MAKEYIFKDGAWARDEFMYVYSPIVKTYPEFVQEKDCLVNRYDESIDDFQYVSMVTKEKYTSVKVNVKCSFEKYGAPLVVFGSDMREKVGRDGKNHMFYGVHFEVVAWEEGCNIWYLVPAPERTEHPVKPTKLLGERFAVEKGSLVDMTVEVAGKRISVDLNGRRFSVECSAIPDDFHVGYTACEGINKLYKMKIE